MRKIKNIHKAETAPIADLITFRALPARSIDMDALNPFIFLNHHGPQIYHPGNSGLPFGPHPHRGIETVTFILDGDIMHEDSGGHKSTITSGGIQWMTAGRGLIHAETSSAKFKDEGGRLEILQLWLNLPAKNKMDAPLYKGFQKEDIPLKDNGKVKINIISGEYEGTQGVHKSVTNVQLLLVNFTKDSLIEFSFPPEDVIFFYVIRGELEVNERKVSGLQLVEFESDHPLIKIKSLNDSILLLGSAPPLKEPIAAQGPFVMNTEDEIYQAYEDYKNGKFGNWGG